MADENIPLKLLVHRSYFTESFIFPSNCWCKSNGAFGKWSEIFKIRITIVPLNLPPKGWENRNSSYTSPTFSQRNYVQWVVGDGEKMYRWKLTADRKLGVRKNASEWQWMCVSASTLRQRDWTGMNFEWRSGDCVRRGVFWRRGGKVSALRAAAVRTFPLHIGHSMRHHPDQLRLVLHHLCAQMQQTQL